MVIVCTYVFEAIAEKLLLFLHVLFFLFLVQFLFVVAAAAAAAAICSMHMIFVLKLANSEKTCKSISHDISNKIAARTLHTLLW